MTVKNIDPLVDASAEEQQDALIDGVMTQDLMPEVSDIAQVGLEEAPEPEQVEVAGLKDVFTVFAKSAKRTGDEPNLVGKTELDEAEMIVPTKGAVEGAPPETIFNLNKINGPDELKQHIDQVAQASGAGQIERMDFGQLTSKIEEMGYSEAFVRKIINPNAKLNADPGEVYKMMLALTDAGKRSQDLAKKIEAGDFTDETLVEFRQAVALEGAISRGAKRKQADVARSLSIFNQARTAEADRAFRLEEVLNASGGRDDAVALAKAYLSAGGPEKAAQLAERTLGGRVKDIWITTWINGILSSPVTHIKNMTANAAYAGLNLAEKQTAALIGKTRNILFNSPDYIRQQEIFVDMYSMGQGLREGFALGKQAWTQNKQITGRSKLETRTVSDPFAIEVAEDASEFQKAMAKGFGYYGKFVTLPGRALMAEDEFFKAFNYRRHLNSIGYREYTKARNEFLDAGDDLAVAEQKAQQRMADLLNDPPDGLHREAVDFAEEMTFTGKLEGNLAAMEKIAQHPVMKVYIPFIRTPTNIAIELNKRLPTAFASKKVREDWAAGGVRRDMVIAKMTLGSGMMYGISSLALEGGITGAGPFSPDQKNALKATGWQPYSIVFDKKDVSPETLAEFEKYTTVTSGNEKVFVSYAGLEPIGALMGMGATLGEYSIMEPDAKNMEDLMMGLVIGTSDYVSELPMVSGISEIMQTFVGRGKEGADYYASVIKRLSEQAGEVAIGGTPAGAYSSLIAYTDRVLNPERRIPRADIEEYDDLNPVAKGFIDSLAQYKSRNPFLSGKVPQQLDPITGEQLTHAASSAWMRAFPFRISEQKYSPAYDVINVFDVGQYKPKRKIDGVELTPSQYNRWIELATSEPNEYGKTLEDSIAELPYDNAFMSMAQESPLDAQKYIKQIISDFYKDAKQQLLDEEIGLVVGADIKKAGKEMKIESRIEAMLP
jgi:hypothetical protein